VREQQRHHVRVPRARRLVQRRLAALVDRAHGSRSLERKGRRGRGRGRAPP
jgi:hypothetical protein